ncbi:MAG: efflux RND transporter periplasmic adaptor subunit [Lachnospiraceae bacterium]|nr:efflux RND transporter periplasmic adaptor subunit [Lachnospiraceae bacterium]
MSEKKTTEPNETATGTDNADAKTITKETEPATGTNVVQTAAPVEKAESKAASKSDSEAKKEVSDSSSRSSALSLPKHKKGKKWLIILAVILIAVIALVFYVINKGKNAITPVTVTTVSNGSIEVISSYSGTIASNELKSYYSQVTAPISEMKLHVGDRVKKGDLLYKYAEDDLALLKEQASLTLAQSEGNYTGSLQKNAIATINANGMSLSAINSRLDEITAQVDSLNDKINEKTARMQQTLTDLQKTTMDVDQNGISDTTDAAQGNTAPTDRMTEKDEKDKNKQMSLALQESINDVQYALQYDPELLAWKKQINDLNEEKNRLSEASAAESARMTSGDRTALEAQKELSSLENSNTIASIESVENGITAEFDGVVTEVSAEEGAMAQKGSKVITITSTDDIRIDIQISKSDIGRVKEGQLADVTISGESYTGKVAQISGAASKNSSGVAVVNTQISIDNPSDSIILGTEATTRIHTDKADDTLVVSYEYIGADADGDFVYMIDDSGMLYRRNVTIGLSTSTDAQIIEGLEAGDVIVTADPDSLYEGMPVLPEMENE